MGPGMAYTLPKGFDSSGIWRFTTADTTEPHEAVLVRLNGSTTTADLVAWAKAPNGPPPVDVLGGFGALGPSRQGWMDLGKRPTSGTCGLNGSMAPSICDWPRWSRTRRCGGPASRYGRMSGDLVGHMGFARYRLKAKWATMSS